MRLEMKLGTKRNRQAGQALALTTIGLAAMMGFAGLGIDMGLMRYEKRLQQTAADAAAIAGANNLAFASGVTAGGQAASAANGFTDNAGGTLSTCTAAGAAIGKICVQINNPPSTGPHAANSKYVEAYVSVVHPTFFMRILGSNFSKTVITARAVATNTSGSPSSGCLYTLGAPSAPNEGISINGNATLNATNCGIVDDGDFDTKGNALNVNSGSFGISGTRNSNGPGGSVTCVVPGPCPATGTPATADPLANLPPPCSPCTGGTKLTVAKNGTANPGTYTSISTSGNATFNPGTYVLNGGSLSLGGNSTITGNGVTFYLTNGATVSANGGGNRLDMDFTAPTSGTYSGILFFQDRADTAGASFGGDDQTQFNGVLYFPSAPVTFFGNASTGTTGILIAASLSLSGHPTVNLQGASALPGANPILDAVLVE